MGNKSYYALVQGRFYEGDIEGERYHWKKGIPGSMQLANDLSQGKEVNFVYYRTWDKDTKKGKYFYGEGIFDNISLKEFKNDKKEIEYYALIKQYKPYGVPVVVQESLRKKVWPGANRQAGIKRIKKDIFHEISEPGLKPSKLTGAALMIGDHNFESLLNDQLKPGDLKDSEGVHTVKRTITTEVYKRTKKIIKSLKKLYKGTCQITGDKLDTSRKFGVDVTEAHHIQYLCNDGLDADPSNIIIISPEWHRLIHKENPDFDRDSLTFIFENRNILKIQYPGHLDKY